MELFDPAARDLNAPAMPHRFHVPDADRVGLSVRLPDGEATHLRRVLRLKPGDAVRVFDGQGHELAARVRTVTPDEVRVDTLAVADAAREPRVAITLAQAVLKGRKFDLVIRDATMLGVTLVQPLTTAHTDTPDAAFRNPSAQARWGRVAVSSAKQSGRAVIPVIHAPASFRQHIEMTQGALPHRSRRTTRRPAIAYTRHTRPARAARTSHGHHRTRRGMVARGSRVCPGGRVPPPHAGRPNTPRRGGAGRGTFSAAVSLGRAVELEPGVEPALY